MRACVGGECRLALTPTLARTIYQDDFLKEADEDVSKMAVLLNVALEAAPVDMHMSIQQARAAPRRTATAPAAHLLLPEPSWPCPMPAARAAAWRALTPGPGPYPRPDARPDPPHYNSSSRRCTGHAHAPCPMLMPHVPIPHAHAHAHTDHAPCPMRQHAHRVKGAAGNLGMKALQETCALLEHNAKVRSLTRGI